MGAMFRSEEMALAQLFIQPEAAYTSMSEMGEIGIVQFRDLNKEVNEFQRKFVHEVRRCDEMERKLRYIEAELRKDDVHIPEAEDPPKTPNPREIIDLEAYLEKSEGEIKELSESGVILMSNFLELTELKKVLEKTERFFLEQEDTIQKCLIAEDGRNASIRGGLGFIAGVVERSRVPAFERMLWRISKGNVFFRQAEIDEPLKDPATGDAIYKTIFVLFFQGGQLKSRIAKVCAGFHATLYPCPITPTERKEMFSGLKTRLQDLNIILNQTQDHRARVLTSVAKELQNWSIMVRKTKAIYHTLNFFNVDVIKKCLIGECWVPVADITIVKQAIADGSSASGSSITSFMNVIQTSENPPTFNRANKFTRGFQNLIDAYGVASYREVNPALYTIITFPFLFALMFGDAGHGLILLLFGLYMCCFEKSLAAKKIKNEIWTIFFGGRYIILLMGLFSIYTGVLYNDVFSKSVNIFGSGWADGFGNPQKNYTFETINSTRYFTLDPKDDFSGVQYSLGLDPVWQVAKNKIIFLNTFKMKMSIVIGVVHMIFGVSISVINYIFFKKKENIFLDFIPQILFLLCLFFWMVVLMFIKWFKYGPTKPELSSPFCAPSVLILFINMMLLNESDPPKSETITCDVFMFEGQKGVQMALVGIALACVPVLLVAKPFYIMRNKSKAHKSGPNGEQQQEVVAGDDEHKEEPMSEVFIYQGIHCIEYVLSTVSHTASYLRLWALSLAHAQLSEVLWTMVLRKALIGNSYINAIILYVIFAAWAVLTLGVLVMMEGLSAFLHTLRLHWVEFMSKFYEGLGYPFQPFSFKVMLEEEDEQADE